MTTGEQAPKEKQPIDGKTRKLGHQEQEACTHTEHEDGVGDLIQCVGESQKHLWECLNIPWRERWLHPVRYGWRHPVKIYHLQQIASHLHSILFYLDTRRDALASDEPKKTSLRSLLVQLQNPGRLTRDSAWELAGEFERQCIELGDDTYLYTLLKDQVGNEEDGRNKIKRVPAIARWNDCFPSKDLEALYDGYERNTYKLNAQVLRRGRFRDDPTRHRARYFLRHLHLVRSEEYRRDRAKISLRARYLTRLVPFLVGLLVLLCYSYINVHIHFDPKLAAAEQPVPFPVFLLLFVFSSGALGGILSRAYRLGRQSLSVESASPADEASMGIRSLLSEGKSLFAQVAIGGTSAVVVYLVLQIIFPAGINPNSIDPFVGYGVIGFLAGYSEPFFARVLSESRGMGQSYSNLQ